jgi:Fe-S cluster assembly iron-binding protein IscA
MDTEQIVESIKQIVDSKSGKYLKDIQVDILRGALKQEGYIKISQATNRSSDSIRK